MTDEKDKDNQDHEGVQWFNSDGAKLTAKATDDPKAEGGYFVSYKEDDSDHVTSVYNSDGTLADVKANDEWQDTERQD